MKIWIRPDGTTCPPASLMDHDITALLHHNDPITEICVFAKDLFTTSTASFCISVITKLWNANNDTEKLTFISIYVDPFSTNVKGQTEKLKNTVRTLAANLVSNIRVVLACLNPSLPITESELSCYCEFIDAIKETEIEISALHPTLRHGVNENIITEYYQRLTECGISNYELESSTYYMIIDQRTCVDYITPDVYSDRVLRFFDYWIAQKKEGKKLRIRDFENIAGSIRNRYTFPCGLGGACRGIYVVYSQGIRNICKGRILEFKPTCKLCRWISICQAGCSFEIDNLNNNRFCSAYKAIYDYIIPRMIDFLREIGRCTTQKTQEDNKPSSNI